MVFLKTVTYVKQKGFSATIAVKFFVTIWSLISGFVPYVSSTSSNHLLEDIKPVLAPHKVIIPRELNIFYGLSLIHVVKLHEREQMIRLHLRVAMAWKDPFYQWEPEDYENRTSILIPSEETWIPDIVLFNLVQEEYKTQMEDTFVIVYHDGSVYYSYSIAAHALCLVDVTYFPFDEQVCQLVIGSWSYSMAVLNLSLAPNSNDLTDYKENSAWNLRGFHSNRVQIKYGCCPDPYAILLFSINLSRKWSIHGTYLILPNFIMNLLCIVQFLMPCDSNERSSFGVTLYFALLVYLLLIESTLPATNTFPLFVTYIFITLIEASVAQVSTMYILYLHNKGTHDHNTEVPLWMKNIVLHRLSNLIGMRQLILPDDLKEKLKAGYEEHVNRVFNNPILARQDKYVQVDLSAETPDVNDEHSHNNYQENIGDDRTTSHTTQINSSKTTVRQSASNLEHKADPSLQRNSLTSEVLGGIEKHITHIGYSELEENREFLLFSIAKVIAYFEQQNYEEKRTLIIRQEWQQVAMILDRTLYYIYVGFNFILWGVLLYMVLRYQLKKDS